MSGGQAMILCWLTADRKSTRLNSSHLVISYAVFCLKKKEHGNEESFDPTVKTTATTPMGESWYGAATYHARPSNEANVFNDFMPRVGFFFFSDAKAPLRVPFFPPPHLWSL